MRGSLTTLLKRIRQLRRGQKRPPAPGLRLWHPNSQHERKSSREREVQISANEGIGDWYTSERLKQSDLRSGETTRSTVDSELAGTRDIRLSN